MSRPPLPPDAPPPDTIAEMIDENSALALVRRLTTRHVREHALTLEETDDLCRAIGALDDWLSSGNRLPEAWQRAVRPPV